MNKRPVIVFMGTPEFAVPSLDMLLAHGYFVAAVVTTPDKPSGRGQKLSMSAVKQYADAKGLRVLQPEKLRDTDFIQTLASLNPDIFVVVAFRILPAEVWKIPRLGTFNLHASLLPQYRGAAPINHAIMQGETQTGCTSFLIDDQIDTGKILSVEKCDIHPDENAGSLHDRLMHLGAGLVVKTVEGLLINTLAPKSQSMLLNKEESLKSAPKLFKQDCLINWNNSGISIHNKIRGLSPYPGAYTLIRKGDGPVLSLKILRSSFHPTATSIPGRIHRENDLLKIDCHDGEIHIYDLQLQGKKQMDTESFLRGFNLEGFENVNL